MRGTDRLTKMAKDTGGKHYNAKTAEQLIKAFYDIEQETYAEIAVKGIQEKWRKDAADPITGTDYDFVPGLKGKLVTNIIYHVPNETYWDKQGQKYFNIHIDNSVPGFWDEHLGGMLGEQHIPHMEDGWSLPQVGRITMYKRDQRSPEDYEEYEYKATVAHEFGHTLGLGDAYPGANGGKTLINNAEISDGDFGKTGSIMFRNGTVYSNDVEMVLEAFATNKWQYPIDKLFYKKSRVVRLPQQFK